MAIALQRFCINRKIAPSLSIEAFFRLVSELGLHKVELRNDLPSGKVTDELYPPAGAQASRPIPALKF